MIVFDTSALVRFFTKDIPRDAEVIKNLIDGKETIKIADVVFPELEYVLLGKTYNATRSKIYESFLFLIARKNIEVSKEVEGAVSIYKSSKLDMADCIIVATARKQNLVSFDKQTLKIHKDLEK